MANEAHAIREKISNGNDLSAFLNNEETPVFTNGIPVRHACDIVGDSLMFVLLISGLEFRRQQTDIGIERVKELADDVPCLCTHARYLVVAVKMLPQKLFELLLLLGNFPAESDQRGSSPDFVQCDRAGLRDIHCALSDQISRQRIDHAPHGFMDQPPSGDFRVLLSGHCQMTCKYADSLKLLLRDE